MSDLLNSTALSSAEIDLNDDATLRALHAAITRALEERRAVGIEVPADGQDGTAADDRRGDRGSAAEAVARDPVAKLARNGGLTAQRSLPRDGPGGGGDRIGRTPTADVRPRPAARTIEDTSAHYGWTRTFIYGQLSIGELEALKAGRRTLITTESAERLFRKLPRASFTAPKRQEGAVRPPENDGVGPACQRGKPDPIETSRAHHIASLTPVEQRFVESALACVYAGDEIDGDSAITYALQGFSAELRSKLGRAILDHLEKDATHTGDWSVWAETCWDAALPSLREAAEPFRRKLDVAAARYRARHTRDPRRSELARTAMRLIRQGATGRNLLIELYQINAGFDRPLPDDAIGSVAVWAAKAVHRGEYAARQ